MPYKCAIPIGQFAHGGHGEIGILPQSNTHIGDRAVTVGVDPALVAQAKLLTRQLQALAEILPFSPMSPDLVARAVVRAVSYDLAVVPVRAEAWLGYVMHRVAPGINRRMTQPFSFDLVEKLAGPILDRVMPATAAKEPVPSR